MYTCARTHALTHAHAHKHTHYTINVSYTMLIYIQKLGFVICHYMTVYIGVHHLMCTALDCAENVCESQLMVQGHRTLQLHVNWTSTQPFLLPLTCVELKKIHDCKLMSFMLLGWQVGSVVRALDWRSKGRGFKSCQEHKKNFQNGQKGCADSLSVCPSPCVYTHTYERPY